ncbi:hypothetical protein FXO38_01678 [Capsicum annuum]|nr:hypothetical protein FXO37_12696 [Capsicum annuum]KAF3681498.1 hypothetical protein FXO38_01678 [Capsicum annuum]
MASYQLLNTHSDHHHHQQQVQNCSSSSSSSSLCSETTQRGCSKAQNCLFKILRIISTVPPHNNCCYKENGCNGFAAIDLNIGFNNVNNVPSEKMEEEEESGSPVGGGSAGEERPAAAECGGVDYENGGDKSCEGEAYVVQLQSNEVIDGISETSGSKEETGREELKGQQGFMGLLIEAATLIFGDFSNDKPKFECFTETKRFKSESAIEKLKTDEHDDVSDTAKQVKRRNYACTEEVIVENESSYPLVRSKRGRIQVLPNKYKDSILEPLTPFSRIRSTIAPNRRRSK